MSDAYEQLMALAGAFLESFNTGDVDRMMAYFDDADCVYEDPTGGIHREASRFAQRCIPTLPEFGGRYDTTPRDLSPTHIRIRR